MDASPRTCLSRERARGGAPLCFDSLHSGGGDPAGESLPLLERVFLLLRPGLGGAMGGVKDPLEDAADQAPGGCTGWAGPGLRQRQQIRGGGTGEGRTELAGGVPPGSAWGTHWAGVGSSRHSLLEAVCL